MKNLYIGSGTNTSAICGVTVINNDRSSISLIMLVEKKARLGFLEISNKPRCNNFAPCFFNIDAGDHSDLGKGSVVNNLNICVELCFKHNFPLGLCTSTEDGRLLFETISWVPYDLVQKSRLPVMRNKGTHFLVAGPIGSIPP